MHADLGVQLTGLGVLEGVGSGIEAVLLVAWRLTCIDGEGESVDLRLVEPDPCEHLAVGAEVESLVELKFLFIHPVGLAVDDLVVLSVFGDLALCVVEEQFDEEDVVVAYKTDDVAVG